MNEKYTSSLIKHQRGLQQHLELLLSWKMWNWTAYGIWCFLKGEGGQCILSCS